MHPSGSGQLVAELEIPVPERLAVGRGNAFVVGGHCRLPGSRTGRLWLEVGGERQPVDHFRWPREDVYDSDPSAEAFRSGFVTVARVAPRARAET